MNLTTLSPGADIETLIRVFNNNMNFIARESNKTQVSNTQTVVKSTATVPGGSTGGSSSSAPNITEVLAQGGTDVSVTEFEYLNGVTSSIQTQINNLVTDEIVDGVLDVAPSQNAVFDALELKQDKNGNLDMGTFVSPLNGVVDFGTY